MALNETTHDEANSTDVEMKRLRWRCRRGMRELDQAMLAYLDHHYRDATDEQKQHFHSLLEMQDPEVMSLVSGKTSRVEFDPIIQKMRTALDT